MKPIIYLDMDGVLADFEGWAARQFGDWRKEIESPNWGRFSEFPNLFELLPVMDGAVELYQTCVEVIGDKNQVQILTALPNRAEISMLDAAKHKTEWARKNISPDIRVHFGPYAQHKMLHVRHKHDILIDDIGRNVDQWESAGGIGIWHVTMKCTINDLLRLEIK